MAILFYVVYVMVMFFFADCFVVAMLPVVVILVFAVLAVVALLF